MPYNGSGSYSAPGANFPAVANTTILSADYNAVINDVATALSTCILKDGQQTVTADIPFNSNKLTGLAAGTALTDAASITQIIGETGVYVATVGGTADVITLTPSPAITAYAAGQRFVFIASGVNTTNVTVNISGLGAKAVTKSGTFALVAGDIPSSALVTIIYDGTQFQLMLLGNTGLLTEDSRTSTVDTFMLRSTTSGTPAAGIGTGMLVQAESGDETPSDFGQWEFAASDVSAGSEDTYFQLQLRIAGAALATAYRFAATAANNAIFTHANSADRTYTLPDFDGTLATLAGTESLTNKTITAPVLSGTATGTYTLGGTPTVSSPTITTPTISGAAPATPTANVLYEDSFCKGWCHISSTQTITKDVNVDSITDNGTGDATVNWATDFADGNFCTVTAGWEDTTGNDTTQCSIRSQAAGSVRVFIEDTGGTAVNVAMTVASFGDQ